MNTIVELNLKKINNLLSLKNNLGLIINTIKVGWYPICNIVSVYILSSLGKFDTNINVNIIYLFIQGIINLVIIQPTLSAQNRFIVNWGNISLIRYILGLLIIYFNSYYSLFLSSVILIDVYSKLSNKNNLWVYLPGTILLAILLLSNELNNFKYWYLLSIIFHIGRNDFQYIKTCIIRNYKNTLSVFYQWFYSVGYLIVILQIYNNSLFYQVREIQVYFGLSTMIMTILEFNALKSKNTTITMLRYTVPIVIAIFSIILGNNYFIVFAFCISSIIYMSSMNKVIQLKYKGRFWIINKSHRFAFLFQLMAIIFVAYFISITYYNDFHIMIVIIIMIIIPNLIFLLKTKSL